MRSSIIENTPKKPQQDSYRTLSASKSALMPPLALQSDRPIRKADDQRAVRLRVNRFSWSRMTSTAPPGIARFEGTLDHYSGDGVIVFFNDPLPTPEPTEPAIAMAIAMREAAQQVLKTWRRHGHDLGFSVGNSQGFATLGPIGFAECMDYTAIGQ
jgi:class 3 adenylate cyclase